MTDGREQARTRRLEVALHYALGYLAALEAYAQTPEQRQSVAVLRCEIYNWMAPPANEGANETGANE